MTYHTHTGRTKIRKVMGEFKRGKLRSGSGEKVTKASQAMAIALSVARKSKRKGKKK